jgi:hypothetical protein
VSDKLEVWLESLSVRQADGTWLVQVPAIGSPVPLIYSLPDDVTRKTYFHKARQTGRLHQLMTVVGTFTYLFIAVPVLAIPLRFVSLPIWTMWGFLLPLIAFVLWAAKATPRREEALHAWLATIGSPVDSRSGQAGVKGMVLRSRQEMADGWNAMRPTWMFAVELLAVGISAVALLLAPIFEPMRCSRWNKGFTLFGVCFTEIGLMWWALAAFLLASHGWRWYRCLRQRAALRGGY